MPVAGEGNSPELIAPPPGCEAVSQSSDAGRCNYEYACAGETHFVGCRREADRRWACECGTFSSQTRHFEFAGVEGAEEACGVVARTCESDPIAGEVTCEHKGKTVDVRSCSAEATCGPELEVGPGIMARAVEHYRSECTGYETADGEREFTCACRGGALHGKTYVLGAPSLEEVCEPMVAFCTGDEPPVFSATESCVDRPVTTTVTDGCSFSKDCEDSQSIGDGVSIEQTKSRSLSCVRQNDGTSACQCHDGETFFDFEARMDATRPGACAGAITACSPESMMEQRGAVTCTSTVSDPTDPLSCQGVLTCKQPLAIDGAEVTGFGYLLVRCQQERSAGPWRCSCASSGATAKLDLPSGVGGEAACTDATAHCREELGVVIGLGSSTIPPPP